jgi:hypothetical protein
MSADQAPEPISLNQRRAWDGLWAFLLSPLEDAPEGEESPPPEAIRVDEELAR